MFSGVPGILRKQSGEEISIKGSFQKGKVYLNDVKLVVEEGDQLVRTLPNGLEEVHYVVDRTYYTGRLRHIECATSKRAPVDVATSNISADLPKAIADLGEVLTLLQEIRTALEELGEAQQVTREDLVARLETIASEERGGDKGDMAMLMIQQLLSGANNIASNAVFAIALAALSHPG
jgi:hypothetical protein